MLKIWICERNLKVSKVGLQEVGPKTKVNMGCLLRVLQN